MIQVPVRITITLIAILTLAGCALSGAGGMEINKIAAARSASYLGETPPGLTPELFAPGVVNTEAIELNGVVSPDGREFFFTRVVDDVFTMYRSVLGADGWTDPEPVRPYEGDERRMAVDMAYAPNGETLYFLGRGSTDLVLGERNGLNLWSVERRGNGWHNARVAGWRTRSATREPINAWLSASHGAEAIAPCWVTPTEIVTSTSTMRAASSSISVKKSDPAIPQRLWTPTETA